jgi:hypothetical protein
MRRSAPLRRRTRLAPRSAKRQAITEERRLFVERILRERRWCQFAIHPEAPTCGERTVDVHEPWTRSRLGPIVPSQGLTDDMVVALCRQHHDWIHDNSAAATRLGYLVSPTTPRSNPMTTTLCVACQHAYGQHGSANQGGACLSDECSCAGYVYPTRTVEHRDARPRKARQTPIEKADAALAAAHARLDLCVNALMTRRAALDEIAARRVGAEADVLEARDALYAATEAVNAAVLARTAVLLDDKATR